MKAEDAVDMVGKRVKVNLERRPPLYGLLAWAGGTMSRIRLDNGEEVYVLTALLSRVPRSDL